MLLKSLKPPGKPSEETFISSGVSSKPAGCSGCQFRTQGAGFVADYVPKNPKIGLLLPYPSSDDVMEQRPWAGKAGWAWTKTFLEPLGLAREDVLIAHALRCQPKRYEYPTAAVKRSAELSCRQYDDKRWAPSGPTDGGLVTWDPTLFVITLHPGDARMVPAYKKLILADLGKAVRKAAEGHRPLVLCGTATLDLVAPYLSGKGGSHDWRGHWWEGSWPWKEAPEVTPMFSEPTRKIWK